MLRGGTLIISLSGQDHTELFINQDRQASQHVDDDEDDDDDQEGGGDDEQEKIGYNSDIDGDDFDEFVDEEGEGFEMNWEKNTFKYMPDPTLDFPNVEPKQNFTKRNDSAKLVFLHRWWPTKKKCIESIGKKAILDGYQYKPKKTNAITYNVVCVDPKCQWSINCGACLDGKGFQVKKFNDNHTCSKTIISGHHRNATAKLVGYMIKDELSDINREIRPKDIMKDMSRRHGLNLTYSQAYRSKNKGLEMLMGSPYESFQKLPYYCYNLRNVNPGTRTNIKVDEHGRFEMLFIALGVALRWSYLNDSFMNYLRPLVIIDGAHLKDDVYHGVNLLAVGMDGNNQTLPIAFGICQGEDGAGWTWFLEELKACISQKPNLSIISNRHPAILESVKKVFLNAFHGFCCRHLMMNAVIKKEKHKAVYWEACKADTIEAFDECMDYIQSAIPTAYVKLVKAGFIRWSRDHCPTNRYNYLTSNTAESVNSF
ncbi:transposase, MuDR, MULE transposase domain protein [Tanacetum coccineum]